MTKAEIVNNEKRMDAGSGNFRGRGREPGQSFSWLQGNTCEKIARQSMKMSRGKAAAGLGPGEFLKSFKR
jgi:hypothetical protein